VQLIIHNLYFLDQVTNISLGRLSDFIDCELNLMRIFFCESKQFEHGFLNFRSPRLNMKAIFYDISLVLSALSEGSIEICEFKLFFIANFSFKLIFDLEFRCLSGES